MNSSSSRTVIFITGAFVTHLGWSDWQTYFQNKGYNTIAPAWPGKDGKPAELRAKHPLGNPELAALPFKKLVDHFADIAKSYAEKPIVIGHSTGGLIAQILTNRDLSSAGVAIHPVPPQGVIPFELSFLRGGGQSLGLFTSVKKTYLMSLKKWQYAFTNGMTVEEQKKTYDENVIPESKTMARGALTSAAKIDFKKSHPPLLITSGDKDTIIPATLNLRNFKKYKQRPDSVTEYKEFPGRNHYVLGLPTWKEDADYILDWLDRQLPARPVSTNFANRGQEIIGVN